MKKFAMETWVQLATSFAVILGLGAVIYELEQTRQIAFTEMVQEAMTAIAERDLTLFGEDAAATIAKACYSPAELNEAEKVVLNAVFSAEIRFAIRIKLLEDTGGGNTPWLNNVQTAVNYISGFPQGANWLVVDNYTWDRQFNEAVATAIENRSSSTCQDNISMLDYH